MVQGAGPSKVLLCSCVCSIESTIEFSVVLAGPSKVLMCVIPADVDFSTCEAIKMAGKVDPEGVWPKLRLWVTAHCAFPITDTPRQAGDLMSDRKF